MDIEKERKAFDQYFKEKYPELYKDVFDPDGDERAIIGYSFAWSAWQAKAQVVPEESKHEGGYYLQDCRGYIGNCMKFWYTHGYGAKLHNFHWFPTLDDALEAAGGAPWHKPWYAPYVDSLAEKTIDMQLADREQEKAMIEAQEPTND